LLGREWQKTLEFIFRFYNQISIVFYRDPNKNGYFSKRMSHGKLNFREEMIVRTMMLPHVIKIHQSLESLF